MALVLDMPMQENAATPVVDDVSASNNNGTFGFGNTADYSEADAPGGSYARSLNGSDIVLASDGLAITSSTIADDENGSITFWAKLADTTEGGSLSSDSLALSYDDLDGGVTLKVLTGGGANEYQPDLAESPASFTAWTFYSIVFQANGTLSFYINGTFAESFAGRSGDFVFAFEDTFFNDLRGHLCGLRIYSHAISQSEIDSDYALGVSPPTNQDPPTINAFLAVVGSEIQVNNGQWIGLGSLAYQWVQADDDSGTGAAAISGATSNTYTPTAGDATKFLACTVTPSNVGGVGDSETTEYIPCFASAALPPRESLGELADTTAFNGKFLFTEATSDSGATQPDPLTWKDEAPQNTVDWSFFTIATGSRSNGGGATLISPSFVTQALHATASALRFMQSDGSEITRSVDESWTIQGDLQLSRLDSPITTIAPIAILYDSSIVSGVYALAIEMDRHLNRLQIEAPHDNTNSSTILLSPGADDIEGGDSGKPAVVIFGTRPVLVLTNFHTADSTEGRGPNPSHYITELSAILATEGESLTLVAIGSVPPTGAIRQAINSPIRCAIGGGYSDDED